MAKIQSGIVTLVSPDYLFALADEHGKNIRVNKNGSLSLKINGKKYIVLNEKGEY